MEQDEGPPDTASSTWKHRQNSLLRPRPQSSWSRQMSASVCGCVKTEGRLLALAISMSNGPERGGIHPVLERVTSIHWMGAFSSVAEELWSCCWIWTYLLCGEDDPMFAQRGPELVDESVFETVPGDTRRQQTLRRCSLLSPLLSTDRQPDVSPAFQKLESDTRSLLVILRFYRSCHRQFKQH